MTKQEITSLEKAFTQLYSFKYKEFAFFMLGHLWSCKTPIKLSQLFILTSNWFSVNEKVANPLDRIKETFIDLKKLGVVNLNMKIETAWVSLNDLGKRTAYLVSQNITQKLILN